LSSLEILVAEGLLPMLSVALHNSRQHLQWRIPPGATLAATSSDSLDWRNAEGAATEHGVRLGIGQPDGENFVLRIEGSPARSLPLDRASQLTLGETLFEFAGAYARRPLEELVKSGAQPTGGAGETGFGGPASSTVVDWFDAVAQMNALVTSATSFYGDAARQVLQAVRLDGVIVVLREKGTDWQIAGSALPCPEVGLLCPFDLLDVLESRPRTRFHGRPSLGEQSLAAERDEIVSPLVDPEGRAIGALYGYRDRGGTSRRRGFRHLEARLFDMLAQSLGIAIERTRREQELARQRANLERSFAPAVLRLVEEEKDLLRGCERDVSVLMADLRGFTGVCQRLSTDGSYELLNQVMEIWTECVMRQEGTLIDYYGDGLEAMWNAPSDQTDHADRAVTAGLAMIDSLPLVSRKWKGRLAEPLRVGIGIHSGSTRVGNIGTPCRLKYGPRGASVNLASRLERVTKAVGVPLLVSKSVARRVSPRIATLRVCRTQVRHFSRPLDLFVPLRQPSSPIVSLAAKVYSESLALYERGDYAGASELLWECPVGSEVPREFLRQQIELATQRTPGRRRDDMRLMALGETLSLAPRD
jgi:adenylate cyclase